jgi:hypothetical protein
LRGVAIYSDLINFLAPVFYQKTGGKEGGKEGGREGGKDRQRDMRLCKGEPCWRISLLHKILYLSEIEEEPWNKMPSSCSLSLSQTHTLFESLW